MSSHSVTALAVCVGLVAWGCHAETARPHGVPVETSKAFVDYVQGDPARWFECVDASEGVVVASVLTCERQAPAQSFKRLCGSAARNALSPLFSKMAAQAQRLRNVGSETQLECDENHPSLCRVPAMNECEPQYEVYFAEKDGPCPLRAVVERDDFQREGPAVDAANAKIRALLASTDCED